jgi:hypothetical protein
VDELQIEYTIYGKQNYDLHIRSNDFHLDYYQLSAINAAGRALYLHIGIRTKHPNVTLACSPLIATSRLPPPYALLCCPKYLSSVRLHDLLIATSRTPPPCTFFDVRSSYHVVSLPSDLKVF